MTSALNAGGPTAEGVARSDVELGVDARFPPEVDARGTA
jgi:hypothetical protein